MDLDKLYKMQEELDNHIWTKHGTLEKMSKEELLDNTILALLVEVGELANTTRCFKHWSTNGMMDKEIVLDELADVLHFYLSIGNQKNIKTQKVNIKRELQEKSLRELFEEIYLYSIFINRFDEDDLEDDLNYVDLGEFIKNLSYKLDFTDQEVEQAYLKKHEENYRRQEEGY